MGLHETKKFCIRYQMAAVDFNEPYLLGLRLGGVHSRYRSVDPTGYGE